MRRDKELALKLRLLGNSYSQIQKKLGVPKSTLSGWLSSVLLSEKSANKILLRAKKKSLAGLIKRNKNQTKLAWERALKIQSEAGEELVDIGKRNLFFIGVSLYWAEGYKRLKVKNGKQVTHHPVSLTNSDPALVRMFLRFLRECCVVPDTKIKAGLRIFEHQNDKELLDYWHKQTRIPLENFSKTYVGVSVSSQHKRPYNQLPYGVLQVVVADTRLFHKIMGYIEKMKVLI